MWFHHTGVHKTHKKLLSRLLHSLPGMQIIAEDLLCSSLALLVQFPHSCKVILYLHVLLKFSFRKLHAGRKILVYPFTDVSFGTCRTYRHRKHKRRSPLRIWFTNGSDIVSLMHFVGRWTEKHALYWLCLMDRTKIRAKINTVPSKNKGGNLV